MPIHVFVDALIVSRQRGDPTGRSHDALVFDLPERVMPPVHQRMAPSGAYDIGRLLGTVASYESNHLAHVGVIIGSKARIAVPKQPHNSAAACVAYTLAGSIALLPPDLLAFRRA